MNKTIEFNTYPKAKRFLLLGLVFLAGCAGANGSASRPGDYVEIANPGFTMSPNAPETIWVPRSYVEQGVPRGNELAKKGYQAATGSAPAPAQQAVPAGAPGSPGTVAVTAPPAVIAIPAAPAPTGLTDTTGKPAALLPQFGLVVALEKNRIFVNLGHDDGIMLAQKLKVYRGGTIVKGLGLAPGEAVGTIEVQGFIGRNGSYGILKQGGPVQTNDLVGFE
jgi:hypothetical protein